MSTISQRSFNARHLSWQDVARSFIPNSAYVEILKNNHSIIMGPRGSGKTTLLKVISPLGRQHNQKLFKGDLPFIGVYISVDIHWKMQMDDFVRKTPQLYGLHRNVAEVIVTISALSSLLRTARYLIRSSGKGDEAELRMESLFCQGVGKSWKLSNNSITIHSLEIELNDYINEIAGFVNELQDSEVVDKDIDYSKLKNFYFYKDFYELYRVAVLILDSVSETQALKWHEKKWAICFDELEIAPRWLQVKLLSMLRSIDQRFLLKLTLNPILPLGLADGSDLNVVAQERADYAVIRTWAVDFRERRKWNSFAGKMVDDLIASKFPGEKIGLRTIVDDYSLRKLAKKVLQENDITFDEGISHFAYLSVEWHIFKLLAAKSERFHRYMVATLKIDPDNPDTESRRASRQSLYRKSYVLAIFYLNIIKSESTRARSRHLLPVYFGAEVLFEACDGNTRALNRVFEDLLALYQKQVYERRYTRLSIEQQSQIYYIVARNFRSDIANYPDASVTIGGRAYNVMELLDRIGNYIHDAMFKEGFHADPVSCFVVDADVSKSFVDLLEVALHLGGIVYLNPIGGVSRTGLYGKTFRISYLLNAYYSLPNVTYSSISLSEILRRTDGRTRQGKLDW